MKNVFVAGHKGMVGSAICRILNKRSDINLLTIDKKTVNLENQSEVNKYFKENKIDEVYLAAAKVGGIHANNTYPADFIFNNLVIQTNIIGAAHENDINKILFLGSSCIYPKSSKQPIPESELLTGLLEKTNEPYAIAKIAGIKLCESFNRQFGRDYRSIMPTNLYGIGDNFHPLNSHVIPGMLRRFHEAKIQNAPQVVVWGTGKPLREFLYVDDMADASVHFMEMSKDILDKNISKDCSHINIGSGNDVSIGDLAKLIAETVEYNGQVVFDTTKPDGTPRKLLDVNLATKLGWKYKTNLKQGLSITYKWFKEFAV